MAFFYNPNNILMESVFLSKNDLYRNFDKFENGKSNILLITGLTGSGKSTLASQMSSKYRAEYIELDIMDPHSNMVQQGEDVMRRAGDVYVDFLKSHKKYHERILTNKMSDKEISEMMDNFLKYCFSWCSKRKDKKFIIEGIQIYDYYSYNNITPAYPIIVKNTSVVTSFIRKIKREQWSGKDILKSAPPVIKMMIKDDKNLQKLVSSISD